MPEKYKVGVLVGSLRAGSLNRKLAQAIASLAPDTLDFEFIEIGDLALFNEDLEPSPPEGWTAFRDRIRAIDAVMFVSPEYNRTIPAALKNAIDVGSRPYGQSVWSGKPAAVITGSPSGIGGFGANHNIRQALVFLDMPVMQQPEAYVSGIAAMFGDDGSVNDANTRTFLASIGSRFAEWIATVRG